VGARIFSPYPESKKVGWIVDCGSDFSVEMRSKLETWQTACLMRETPNRLTTKGLNFYGPDEHRGFKYLTPKVRLDENSLTAELLASKSFHCVCSASRCIELVMGITNRRLAELNQTAPIFVWEPVPDLCTPEERSKIMTAASLVDVISPNNQELAAIFTETGQVEATYHEEEYSKAILASGIGKDGHGSIIVRCGSQGCYAASRTKSQWFQAYHKQGGAKVKDPTGGGNTFLGGLAVALARGKSMEEACIWASVAASFAIEQIGMPTLTQEPEGELWNGEGAWKRVNQLRSLACN
jgi:sugar/nucleoside kinase (ribokinase family)